MVSEDFKSEDLTILPTLGYGFTKIDENNHVIALDYIRGGLFDPVKMIPLPPDKEGPDNDLNEKIQHYTEEAQSKGALCKTKEEAYRAAKTILEEELHLRMHPRKPRWCILLKGSASLDLTFGRTTPDAKMKRYRDKVRKITRRQQGKNLNEMIKKLNEVVRGFGNYFGIGNVKNKFLGWTNVHARGYAPSCGKRGLRFQNC